MTRSETKPFYKRPFVIFMAVIALSVTSAIWFIQSPQFARIVKGSAKSYIPGDVGVDADFADFSIKLFPPGISLNKPEISLRERNILKMPAGSAVKADRIDLIFQPFQMLSGDIRVHEVAIVNGDVKLVLEETEKKQAAKPQKFSLKINWDELLQIRGEAVSAENTRVAIQWKNTGDTAGFLARSIRLAQWKGKGGLGYEMQLEVGEIHGTVLKALGAASTLQSVKGSARINELGAQLESLAIQADGLQMEATGAIRGNILNPKALMLEAQMKMDADLHYLPQLIEAAKASDGPKKKSKPLEMAGVASFRGRVAGNLEKIFESLKAEGTLEIENPAYDQWSADRLKIAGAWNASPTGGELIVSKAVVEAAEKPRIDGKPGHGGAVEIGAFKLNLGQPGPFTLPLNLKRAHLHWLLGPETKSVYALDLRASGPLEATFTPAKGKQPWLLQAKVDLSVQDFQLDNQRLGQVKPMTRVLKIPKIQVTGPLTVDPTAFRPNNVTVAINRTKFALGGKVDFKTGYELHATGFAAMTEIDRIAETEIRGEGPLNVHVQGPSDHVLIHFDSELENAAYLNLKLGNFKGRITWDDGLNHLLFTKTQATKNGTNYFAEGMIDLGDAESIALNVKVPEGDVQDLIQVFENLTADLWWLPRTLNGAISGEIQLFGGVNMKKLEVLAKMKGTGWEYLGERLDQVAVIGGYDKGRYHISDFQGSKRHGKVGARIAYDSDQKMDWAVKLENFTLTDLDHVAQLDVPIRGSLFLESVGKGKIGSIASDTRVEITDVAVRGVSMPSSRLVVKSASGRVDLKGMALGGQGTLDAVYDFDPSHPSYLRMEARHLDFSPILLLLNPQSIPDPAVAGFVSGSANLAFRSGHIERSSGFVEISEYLLAKTGTRFNLAQPVSFKVTDGSFEFRDLSFVGNRGRAHLSLQGENAEIQGTVSGELDVSIAEFFTSTVTQSSGLAALNFEIGGSLKEPLVDGKATIDGASFRVPSLDSPFENIVSTIQLKQNIVTVKGFEADLAGGRVAGEGTITLFPDRWPRIALKGSLSGNKLRIFPFQFARVRGPIQVEGDRLPYVVTGNVVVDSALSREKMFQQKSGQSLRATQYTPPPSTRRLSDYPKFKLNIDVKSDGGIFVQNELFDAEVKAHLTVVNTIETPRIVGNAEVVQGRMLFKDRVFHIQSANALFDSPTVLNPRFTMTANTEVNGVKVQLYANGRMEKWKLELSSTPPMQELEIIQLLALGMTSNDVKRLSSSDRALYEQGEAASLLLHSLDFNREVESKTGFQIQLDESVDAQSGSSIFRPQSQKTELGASPKIVIKKQITKNVDISYGSTVGLGNNNQREVNAEVQVVPGVSVIGVWDTYETVNSEKSESSTSFGLDLKLQKRFK